MATKTLGNIVPFRTKLSVRSGPTSKGPKIKHTGHIDLLSIALSDDPVLFIRLAFKFSGKKKTAFFRLDDVSVNSKQFNHLNLAGARLYSNAAKSEFIDRIQAFLEDGKRLKVATRLGWHGLNFVLPKRTFGPNHKALLVHLDDAQPDRFTRFRVGGTMEGWQELGRLAKGNTRVILFLAAGFSGPVAALLDLEQVGFMLVGDPISGKTTVLVVVGSTWGRHVDENKALEAGFAQTFNATDNSLEDDQLAANHTALLLDETRATGRADKEIGASLGGLVMRLSSVVERGRQNATGPRRSSAVPILANSNLSLEQFARLAHTQIDDAHRSRMIAIPLPVGGYGVYKNIHGSKSGAAFSTRLRNIAKAHFGHASRKLLEKLTAENARNPKKLRRWLEVRREYFLRYVEDITSPTQNLDRTKAKFATVYASGRFAIEQEIVEWDKKDLRKSLRSCLLDHVMLVSQEASFNAITGTTGHPAGAKTVLPQPLVQLRGYVLANPDKVVDLAAEGAADRLPLAGSDCQIVKSVHKTNGPEYLFTDKALLMILGDKSRVQKLKLSLHEARHIATNQGSGGELRYSVKRTIPGRGREQFIAIKAVAIDTDA